MTQQTIGPAIDVFIILVSFYQLIQAYRLRNYVAVAAFMVAIFGWGTVLALHAQFGC